MAEQERSRRTFLKIAGAGAAGAALAPQHFARSAFAAVPPAAPAESSVKLGLASYSLRKFPRAKAIELHKTLGVPYVNVKDVHLPYNATPAEFAAAREEYAAAGIRIVGGGTITFSKDTDEDVKRLFEYARNAGMPVIVAAGPAAVFSRVERFAKQYDIKVAIHNHGPEDKVFPSPYDVLKVVKDMDPRMGLCIDIGHTVRTGTDVVKAIADAGPRLLDMHAKDLRDLRERGSQCIVGEGAIPFAAIFRQLEAMRFGGYVNLEYEIDADDPIPGIKQSFAYMRGVLAGIAPAVSRAGS